MAVLRSSFVFWTLMMLSGLAVGLPERRNPQITASPVELHHSCYSYTATVPYDGIMHCPMQTPCGPAPDCIILSRTTLEVPCANSRCPKTPTITVTAPGVCPTCRKGCGVEHLTETKTTGCPSTTACSTTIY